MNSLKLKSVRVGAGEGQKETALALGMHIPQYCNKENGKTPFTTEEIAKIALHFNLESKIVDEIFFDGKLTNRISRERTTAKEAV